MGVHALSAGAPGPVERTVRCGTVAFNLLMDGAERVPTALVHHILLCSSYHHSVTIRYPFVSIRRIIRVLPVHFSIRNTYV